MNDIVWINTTDYTTSQLIWNGVGCLFWVVTYIFLVREIYQRKFVEMPFFIAAGNISWEFIWSFFYHPNTGRLYSLSYQAAFLVDAFIFFNLFRYGVKQINIPISQKHFSLLLIGSMVLWLPLNYFFVRQGLDTPIGATSGYILNIFISLLYPMLYFRSSPKHFSVIVGWCKFLGTGCITVSMFLIYPTNYFIQTLGAACFILDLSYCFLLQRNAKRPAVHKFTNNPTSL